jgi:hypothetical protein
MYSDNKILLTGLTNKKDLEYEVMGINFFPITNNIVSDDGILINKEDFIDVDMSKSKLYDCKLFYNEETKKAYYKYFEKPKTEEDLLKDEIKELKLQQQTTDKITADLAYELMMLKGAN